MNIQLEDQTMSNEALHTLEIEIGTAVKIKRIQDFNRELDSEDYYYLKDFQDKTGTVVEMEGKSYRYFFI